MTTSQRDQAIRPHFGQALGEQFRLVSDRQKRLRSLEQLIAEAATSGLRIDFHHPAYKQSKTVFGSTLPIAYAHQPDWSRATCTTLVERTDKQFLAGIELTYPDSESSLAIYDAASCVKNGLILVRNGEPIEISTHDSTHIQYARTQIVRAAVDFFDQS